MGAMAFQFTSRTIVYSTVYLGADQRKHQTSASLAFVRGIHRGPVKSPHKWPITRKMFPFDNAIMLFWPQCQTNHQYGFHVHPGQGHVVMYRACHAMFPYLNFC